ncbi:hypothetical protein AMTR_s00046p00137150 [Amborella trichopoda]|uniref:Bulb-type lectin domain-containing protein n=1 Tax=Amborella trichopoda TaxID=13333 RepID=U5D982_AMBTC|nr:hypothetical protein AMTR_s00046p00137150 [Amborella trichopoda]
MVRQDSVQNQIQTFRCLELKTGGELFLNDHAGQIGRANMANSTTASTAMQDNGKFMLKGSTPKIVWKSFNHPIDNLTGPNLRSFGRVYAETNNCYVK